MKSSSLMVTISVLKKKLSNRKIDKTIKQIYLPKNWQQVNGGDQQIPTHYNIT